MIWVFVFPYSVSTKIGNNKYVFILERVYILSGTMNILALIK